MIATCGWITKVIGTDIVIIAVNEILTLTGAIYTNITLSADIPIIAGRTIRCGIIDTTMSWITGIVCTGVIIVTRNRSPITSAVYALITCCTGISIIAEVTIHWRKYTSPYWITGIICTRVIIVTRNRSPLTSAVYALITCCTGISVIAGRTIRCEIIDTTLRWITGIVCTGVIIVTRNWGPLTFTICTNIALSAGISIIAGRTIRCGIIDTTLSWITGIICAGVIIVTRNWGPLTFTICTNITLSAGISIITGISIWNKHTAPHWITGIVCAGIIIVTRNKSPLTYTICTTVINCTFIPVITGD